MDEKEWRNSIQEAVKKAAALPSINITGLAKEAGWSPQSLTKFRDKGVGGFEHVKKLERRLVDMNILVREEVEVYGLTEGTDPVECRDCHQQTPSLFAGEKLLFCGHCGSTLGHECKFCGTLNDDDARFCKACGTPLTADAAAEERHDANELARTTEAPAQRRAREAKERAAARKKRGEPEL